MSVPVSASQALIGDFEVDVNRLGNDYKSFDLAADDPELCRDACEQDPRCRAFTYVKPNLQGPLAKCWLKDPVPQPYKNQGCCVSGVKIVTAASSSPAPTHD